MNRMRNRGFTLIEAAVAIAVVAILSGIIVPLVVKNIQDSQNARAKNDVQVFAAAIASQLKDTGGRPSGTGPNGCSGASTAIWGSEGGAAPTGVTIPANNTFVNLFSYGKSDTTEYAAAQTLFGVTSGSEFSYRGPYMAMDVGKKADPWGNKYMILGYNAAGQTANGTIWVVSTGPDKATSNTLTGTPPTAWTSTTTGEDDIVMRVN